MERLCKKLQTPKDLIQYYAANFAFFTDNFLYELEEYGESSFHRWECYKQSLSYNFRNDVEILFDANQNEDLIGTTAVNLLTTNKIAIQTVAILDDFYNFLTPMLENDTINSLVSSYIMRAKKTKGFIKFNKDSISTIIRGSFSKIEYEYE
jgi:hypothetical protein